MKILPTTLLALSLAATPGAASGRTLAAPLCVGAGHGCYPTIQAAIDAAQDGDIVHVGPGTFAGGLTIAKTSLIAPAPERRR